MKQSPSFLILLFASASFLSQAQTVKKLDPQSFDKKIKEVKDPILIDVRTKEEYAQGHLANAKVIDVTSSDFEARVSKLDKLKPIFVYCKAGSRSNKAASILSGLGFKEIYDLNGGITAWCEEKNPVIK